MHIFQDECRMVQLVVVELLIEAFYHYEPTLTV